MILGKKSGWKVVLAAQRAGAAQEGTFSLPDHHQNFLDCIRSGQRPNADIEIGHLTASLCHLGNIATRVGRVVQFDPAQTGARRRRSCRHAPSQVPGALGDAQGRVRDEKDGLAISALPTSLEVSAGHVPRCSPHLRSPLPPGTSRRGDNWSATQQTKVIGVLRQDEWLSAGHVPAGATTLRLPKQEQSWLPSGHARRRAENYRMRGVADQ